MALELSCQVRDRLHGLLTQNPLTHIVDWDDPNLVFGFKSSQQDDFYFPLTKSDCGCVYTPQILNL